MKRQWMMFTPVAVAVAAAVALPIAVGGAQSGPRQITVTSTGEKTHFDDVGPKTMTRGIVSPGDRITSVSDVRIDGKKVGTRHSTAVITNPVPRPFSHFTAVLNGAVHLTDGDMFFVGFVNSAHGGDREIVIGGTGAYAGATGSVALKPPDGAVITLDK